MSVPVVITEGRRIPTEVQQFIERLAKLDPGPRAAFKRNAGATLAESRGVLPELFRITPPKVTRPSDVETYFLIATLHSLPGGSGNFAACLKGIVDRGANKETIARRLAILLDSHRDELPFRLRQLVQLVRSFERPIAWPDLLNDLLRREHPRRIVQKAWADTFFRAIK